MATFVTPQNEIKEQNVKLTQGTLIKQQEKINQELDKETAKRKSSDFPANIAYPVPLLY